MEKKYEFTGETMEVNGVTLNRIRAIKSFDLIEVGQLGVWIEKEENLSHNGNAWVFNEAQVYGNACVCGNAYLYENAKISTNENI